MTCCPGVSDSSTSWPSARLLDAFDKFLGDFKMNIRVQQRIADLARRLFDVASGDSSLPGQIFKYLLKLVRKIIEHAISPIVRDS